ncbi:MAG: hypothetical protein AABY32_01900 [Nanoarchaeota archaeon]
MPYFFRFLRRENETENSIVFTCHDDKGCMAIALWLERSKETGVVLVSDSKGDFYNPFTSVIPLLIRDTIKMIYLWKGEVVSCSIFRNRLTE